MIKEIATIMDTGENKKATFITPPIKGYLKSVILICPTFVSIKICFSDAESIVLYNNLSFSGMEHLPLRTQPVDFNGDVFNYASVCWALNDKLRVTINGAKNTKVAVIIRYEDNMASDNEMVINHG